MNFFSFHLMPWPELGPPRRFLAEHEAAWVTLSNTHYHPGVGARLYDRYLSELVRAEELGLDGVVVNEHHQNAYGLMPSPNLMAAALTRETARVRICVLGNALPLYNPPTRVAEEMAMLDVMSGGRLIAGLVVGGGPEYYSTNVNPTEARPRFREAVDLVVAAWTRPGPFAFDGRYYHLVYVNPWPRPLQQPHPPVWIPGLGSPSTIDYCAQRGYGYMGVAYYAPPETFGRQALAYRAAVARAGRAFDPELLGWLTTVYVADTDEQAVAEAAPHLAYFQGTLAAGFVGPGKVWMPPGYIDPPALVQFLADLRAMVEGPRPTDPAAALWRRSPLVGSPETVRTRLLAFVSELGIGTVLALLQFGSLPADLTARSMELYAREVVPWVRARAEGVIGRPSAPAGTGSSVAVASPGSASPPASSSAHDDPSQWEAVLAAGAGAEPQRSTVRAGGHDATVLRAGRGRPLVYLHGLCDLHAAFDGARFTRFVARLADDGTEVCAPALPGYNGSEGLDDIGDVEDMVWHLADLWEAAGWGSADVVGHSLGGWFAAELALRRPDLVRRLVLVDPLGLHTPGVDVPPFFGAVAPRGIGGAGEARRLLFADPDGPVARAALPDEMAHHRQLLWFAGLAGAARLGWQAPHFQSRRLATRLARVTAPALVVWGTRDQLVPEPAARAWVAGLGRARALEVPGAGHCLPLERPEVAAEVGGFLAGDG